MDVSLLLDDLNDRQREAVAADPGATLVLAGAGSGKTRVLVHRIAWLLMTQQVTPHGLLAVTFTNKAAREMRSRIEALLQRSVQGMWVGTFHSLCHRLLRMHWQDVDLPQTFQILDSDDQLRLIKRTLRNLNIDEARCPPREVQWFINARKDEGLRAHELDEYGDEGYALLLEVYRAYELACRSAGVVDFAELLLRVHEMWREQPAILEHYRRRFSALLVDEFQDTNAIQYAWIRQLAPDGGNVFVVGDDDQSIYSWRGAQVENMQRFQRDYPAASLVRLEQNYRSTGTILAAANALIANNSERLGKDLWTAGDEGAPIQVYTGFNDLDEARYCADQIEAAQQRGTALREIAVLYRVSAQSRLFEDAFRQLGLPYRVYGGFRFYERAEVKDALAYLRLCLSRDDDPAFERVVNLPPRGIGSRTLDEIRLLARDHGCSLWSAAVRLVDTRALASRAANAVTAFLRLIEEASAATNSLDLPEALTEVVERSGLKPHYQKDSSERGLDRIENLEELVVAADEFLRSPAAEEEELDPKLAFLTLAALEAGEGQADPNEDAVQMMTLHSAKGLEFDRVFLVGMEEGLFPHQRCLDDPAALAEERRLCYVGITRARQRLTLAHAESRRLHGTDHYSAPSRFMREIPGELLESVRVGGGVPMSTVSHQTAGLSLGQRVNHAKFGEGVVLNLEGQGEHARVQVNFDAVGAKWLVAAYAKLQAL